MFKEIIFIFVFIFCLTDVVAGDCYDADDVMQRCIPVFSSSNNSFPVTREQLDGTCVELRKSLQCIDNYIKDCMGKLERITFMRMNSGTIGFVNDLCTQGKLQDEYLQHAACLRRAQPEYEECNSNFTKKLFGLTSNGTTGKGPVTGDEYIRTVCCSFQEFFICSEGSVQRMCGDDTAFIISESFKQMQDQIIKTYCLGYTKVECGLTINATTTTTEHTNEVP